MISWFKSFLYKIYDKYPKWISIPIIIIILYTIISIFVVLFELAVISVIFIILGIFLILAYIIYKWIIQPINRKKKILKNIVKSGELNDENTEYVKNVILSDNLDLIESVADDVSYTNDRDAIDKIYEDVVDMIRYLDISPNLFLSFSQIVIEDDIIIPDGNRPFGQGRIEFIRKYYNSFDDYIRLCIIDIENMKETLDSFFKKYFVENAFIKEVENSNSEYIDDYKKRFGMFITKLELLRLKFVELQQNPDKQKILMGR